MQDHSGGKLKKSLSVVFKGDRIKYVAHSRSIVQRTLRFKDHQTLHILGEERVIVGWETPQLGSCVRWK
nr:hypothetical protein [Tanacetum cinerariifolium]